jgi:phosphatidylserine/phosphatidylglycerophosphate/cardiolipin synthase-like enzyme
VPDLYFDPRSVAAAGPRAVLHAKCIVVDDRYSFVTSANFTEAAQERNIEAGIIVEDEAFAVGLRRQFDGLVEVGLLQQIAI